MKVSRLLSELGPQCIAGLLASARESGNEEHIAFFKTLAPEICNAAVDLLCSFESGQQDDRKVRWVADTAAHMLIHHQGEVMDADVDNAVGIAKRIMDRAEKAFAK